MMRGVSTWAVATRKDGEIAVESHPVVSWVTRSRVLRWPVIRGVIALAQSLSIGFKALEISANAQAAEDEEPIGKGTWALTIVAAADTVMTRPSRELMAECYPSVPYRPTAGDHDSLLSSDKARRLLGYEPQHSWREYVAT